jgi:two-component system CheB/CheR fusion protein
MSVNEELQSSNEEMETSKEEIQTVNEELQTVNAELGRKVELLDRANSDLRNLLESMQVGAIFLDRNLVIRSFTEAAREVFNLVRTDEGRMLTDIVHKLDDQNIEKDLREVLREQHSIEKRVVAGNGRAHYFMRIFPYRSIDRSIGGVLLTFVNITSVIAAEKLERELTAELSHRVKNTLTIVNSIASQTARRSSSLESFLQGFLGRVHALAFAHDLLAQTSWTDAPLHDLIRVELEPFLENTAGLTVDGPRVMLKPRATVTLGMVFHELATNAVKYGAFSAPGGKVVISWKVKQVGPAERLELRWVETSGPPVAEHRNHGFGHDFIERAVAYDLEGEARLDFPASGLRCVVGLPVEQKLLSVE